MGAGAWPRMQSPDTDANNIKHNPAPQHESHDMHKIAPHQNMQTTTKPCRTTTTCRTNRFGCVCGPSSLWAATPWRVYSPYHCCSHSPSQRSRIKRLMSNTSVPKPKSLHKVLKLRSAGTCTRDAGQARTHPRSHTRLIHDEQTIRSTALFVERISSGRRRQIK